VLRAERIEPKIRGARRIALYALASAAAGATTAFLASGRSEPILAGAFILVAASVAVGGVAIIFGFVLAIALFFSYTDRRRQ
jgi:hypothetical protein